MNAAGNECLSMYVICGGYHAHLNTADRAIFNRELKKY